MIRVVYTSASHRWKFHLFDTASNGRLLASHEYYFIHFDISNIIFIAGHIIIYWYRAYYWFPHYFHYYFHEAYYHYYHTLFSLVLSLRYIIAAFATPFLYYFIFIGFIIFAILIGSTKYFVLLNFDLLVTWYHTSVLHICTPDWHIISLISAIISYE